MRKIVLYIAMSIDGYIADIRGGVDWLRGDGSDENSIGSYNEFIENVDTVILGYNTYNQIVTELSPDKWVYDGLITYVLTHKSLIDSKNIVFTQQDIESLLLKLKSENGKDIWICGGANIINQVIELDIIDKYCVSIIPIILGDGIRLFSKYNKEKRLSLIQTREYNGIVDLVYRRTL